MKINTASLVVLGLGQFTVDGDMGVWFDEEDYGVYWETHVSMLNVKQYPSLWENFKETAYEEAAEFEITFDEFCKILEKVFQLYYVIKG
ncbi:Hypothetical protein KNT65_gp060 [Escherichia phage EcS1]|uniref:Uncharacterized protein n=1 Tax=Escherichia phage EcS1 TaxID=2083276 RepID=A0A2Z5ZBY5_9CAUD|nr:Hypothetical protein KNT65_gp060 [Escherichia phage EcS1]BBC78108.1 Hypothetical protein [Escherichia phage EcS1]